MVSGLIKKIFGSRNERMVKRMRKSCAQIAEFKERFEALSDAEIKAQTQVFRDRLAAGESLDDLLPEAFALVREAGWRALQMRHFDVQLIGGMVLHQGKIAEMRTGEGKTLVATLAVYLNALPGHGVHVVTVNDYLARRDAEWMGRLYDLLGLSIGVINSSGAMGPDSGSYLIDYGHQETTDGIAHLRPVTRREAYAADITYGTNNEFGFDYLRDNMAFSAEQRVQRERWFAVVDEVDSILIDEARTPLIISGPAEDSSELYTRINKLIPGLRRQPSQGIVEGKEVFGEGDYSVDEKARQVFLSEEGHEHVERLLTQEGLLPEGSSLYDSANIMLMHHVNAALRAHVLFTKDVEYIVRNGEVVIVDEFTGRTMPGRRWSEGLHQAVEAKEAVPIQHENQTLASITFQNYFRLYKKLSGMTGTADTEAYEFQQIYGLEVVVIPTNRPMTRKDMGDLIYLTPKEKYKAIIEDIKACVQSGQPVLVGTASIEASELVSGLLDAEKIPHKVLNAKHHTQEAAIIAHAGRPGAVTIATNMAGRGTDIVLGGSLAAELAALGGEATGDEREAVEAAWAARHEQVLAVGGLHVLGTERHESRRIDNQLRGRSGRQGDPGSTRFYLSMQDSLMRIFASDRMAGLMQKLGMQEGEAIEHPWVTKAIENAQRKVEGRNFDIRKQLLEYDDVANDQRKVVYAQRDELMNLADVSEMVQAMMADVIESIINKHIPPGSLEEQWDVLGLETILAREVNIALPLGQWLKDDEGLHEEGLRQRIHNSIRQKYTDKEQQVGADGLRYFEKAIMLQILDHNWKEHLAAMDYLRQGIHLRGYAQKNPKQEYKREAFEMFSEMLDGIKQDVVTTLMRAEVRPPEDMMPEAPVQDFEFRHEAFNGFGSSQDDIGQNDDAEAQQPIRRSQPKVGRNDPCPCGSGKKYKQCCGRLQ